MINIDIHFLVGFTYSEQNTISGSPRSNADEVVNYFRLIAWLRSGETKAYKNVKDTPAKCRLDYQHCFLWHWDFPKGGSFYGGQHCYCPSLACTELDMRKWWLPMIFICHRSKLKSNMFQTDIILQKCNQKWSSLKNSKSWQKAKHFISNKGWGYNSLLKRWEVVAFTQVNLLE